VKDSSFSKEIIFASSVVNLIIIYQRSVKCVINAVFVVMFIPGAMLVIELSRLLMEVCATFINPHRMP
jgi:hypothetical protein